MWTNTPEGREFITRVSYDLVTQVAPQEIDFFDELITDFYANPSPVSKDQSGNDDPLALGIADILAATTPATAAMITAAVTYIIQEVIKAAQDESAAALTAKIRSFFQPEKESDGLTKAQLQHIYDIGVATAVDFGLPHKEAKHLAQAMIAKSALSA